MEKLQENLNGIKTTINFILVIVIIVLGINIFFGYKYYKATEAINEYKANLNLDVEPNGVESAVELDSTKY
jgi:predicted negative regulator of RcsB-dependent stress response